MKIVLLAACFLLIGAGIYLVVESKNSYKELQQQYSSLAEKFYDSSFKKPITLTAPSYSVVKDGYNQALSYFMLALGLLLFVFLLPRLQNLSIGPAGINLTLKDLQQTVDTLINQANTIQSSSVGEGGKKAGEEPKMRVSKTTDRQTDYPDDPQKGKWGGKTEHNFRKMSATVVESFLPGFYVVDIVVESVNTAFPLKGLVKFHLHNTFLNPDPVIAVKNGKAVLKLTKVWGAFTVGAEADEGATRLELDLSELQHAPQLFRSR